MRLRIAPEEIGLPHVQFQDADGDWRWFCDCVAEWDAEELVRRFNAYEVLVDFAEFLHGMLVTVERDKSIISVNERLGRLLRELKTR